LSTKPIFTDSIEFFESSLRWSALKVAAGIFPKAWRDGDRGITMGSKEIGEAVMGNASGLGQSIHTFVDFNVDVAVED
jgi:hypothetical protein